MTEFIPIHDRIAAFSSLGKMLSITYDDINHPDIGSEVTDVLKNFRLSIEKASLHNPWFTRHNLDFAIRTWAEALSARKIERWIKPNLIKLKTGKTGKVAVIMAGNIPLVGMHDFLCILMAGKQFIGKLSKDDNILLPAIAELLCSAEPRFENLIQFTEGKLDNFNAIIATGSNNTSRYFEYYFSKYPHIIRRNRNGIAVITGKESRKEMEGIGRDICLYFGLGCRSISKVFIPKGYNPRDLLDALAPFNEKLFDHFKYMNNYTYQKTLLQMNLLPFHENGMALLVESEQYYSPVSVVHFEFYDGMKPLAEKLSADRELIQCVVSIDRIPGAILPGTSQQPHLWDYADGIDTMEFLMNL